MAAHFFLDLISLSTITGNLNWCKLCHVDVETELANKKKFTILSKQVKFSFSDHLSFKN